MATHNVSFEIPRKPLGRADVEFRVRRDGRAFGTLTVSNGSIVWFPKGTTKGFKMGWQGFDETMREKASRVERR